MNEELRYQNIKDTDKEIYEFLREEVKRQEDTLELIPSENIVNLPILEAQGSILTNKYSEGYPTKRYYGGNQHIDKIEQLAIDRAKKLFRAEHCNVQPHSGSNMNIATYFALLEKGDTILGMDLGHGGHLTHGHPITHMTKVFNFVRYKTNLETGLIDYDNLEEMAKLHKPKLIIAGFSAYSRSIDWKRFKEIADKVGAITMADVSHIGGLIAGNVLENPLDFGFDIMTTTTHKSLRGPRGGIILCKEEFKTKIDKSVFPSFQGGPLEHIIMAKAICFKQAMEDDFKNYQLQVLKNAKAMEKGFKQENIKICFNETENHLLLIDLRPNEVKGQVIEEILDSCFITLNKNAIPDDKAHPLKPNGIRLGTPAITTRGLLEEDCYKLSIHISKIIKDYENQNLLDEVKNWVSEVCLKYKL